MFIHTCSASVRSGDASRADCAVLGGREGGLDVAELLLQGLGLVLGHVELRRAVLLLVVVIELLLLQCADELVDHLDHLVRRIAKQLNATQTHIRGTRYQIRRMDEPFCLKSLTTFSKPILEYDILCYVIV